MTARLEVLALLARVKELPAEDAPRLALADWLEAHGGPTDSARAAFVRGQCRAARLPADHPERAALWRREGELLGRYEAAWLGMLRPRVGDWRFARGLVEARAPARRLSARVLAALAASEEGAWLGRLCLQFLSIEAVARFARSPLLAHLNALGLAGNRLGSAGVAGLASTSHLRHLTHLDLTESSLGDEGAAVLAGTPLPARLIALDLARNRIGAEGVNALARPGCLARLAHLGLFGNPLRDRGAEILATCPDLVGLTSLDLRRTDLGEAGALALAAAPWLGGLRVLRVEENPLSLRAEAVLRERFGARVYLVAGRS